MGTILLAGGAEFQKRMAEPDLQAIALTGKDDPTVCIIPTAAAPDKNHQRAGNYGIEWFQSLGIKNVSSLPVIDTTSANDKELAESLVKADLIYLLGGFPGYLAKTLRDSTCWSAALDACNRGAVLAGSSAGAMVMCDWFFDPETRIVQSGLGLLSGIIIVPHHETMGKPWVKIFNTQLPDVLIVGIDEQTGMIRKHEHDQWNVYGRGAVTVYQHDKIFKYVAGNPSFCLQTSPEQP